MVPGRCGVKAFSATATSPRFSLQGVVRHPRGEALHRCSGDDRSTRRTIDGDGRPAGAFLVAQVDEQRFRVVLDPQAMTRIRFLVELPNDAPPRMLGSDER